MQGRRGQPKSKPHGYTLLGSMSDRRHKIHASMTSTSREVFRAQIDIRHMHTPHPVHTRNCIRNAKIREDKYSLGVWENDFHLAKQLIWIRSGRYPRNVQRPGDSDLPDLRSWNSASLGGGQKSSLRYSPILHCLSEALASSQLPHWIHIAHCQDQEIPLLCDSCGATVMAG